MGKTDITENENSLIESIKEIIISSRKILYAASILKCFPLTGKSGD